MIQIIDYLRTDLCEYEFQEGSWENLDEIYSIKQENEDFFAKIQKHKVTREESAGDLTACPKGLAVERKHLYVIYEKGKSIAVLDYLEGYPEEETVYIGLLIVRKSLHGKGVGRKINDAFMRSAQKCGFGKIKLGCYAANEKGYRFWRRNRYSAVKMTDRENDGTIYPLICMECDVSDTHMFEPVGVQKPLLREERAEEYHESEWMVKRAFWNKYRPGCDEHYLLHCLRQDEAFVPELSRIAEVDGKIVGGIWYSKSKVIVSGSAYEILTFGPLCVVPEYQGTGIGGLLLTETMRLAKKMGSLGIIILGEPGYYPKYGFLTCDQFGITTADGKNFDAFMGIELQENALKKLSGGTFQEAELFENLSAEAAKEYDRRFPDMEKMKLPGQWE